MVSMVLLTRTLQGILQQNSLYQSALPLFLLYPTEARLSNDTFSKGDTLFKQE